MLSSIRFYLLALILIFFMGACERNIDSDSDSENNSSNSSNSSNNSSSDDDDSYSEYYEVDSDYEWDASDVTTIVFNDNTAEITGEGATFADGILTVSAAGNYLFQGNLSDGEIYVSTDNESIVKLILDNVSVTCSDNPAIYIQKSLRSIIIANENTTNTFADGSTYTDEDANAVIFSKSDLRLAGTGSITVNANYKDGITCKDGLVINSGIYNVTAADDGIRGKDFLVINNGTFNIDSEGDAIKSDNENSSCGYVTINNANFEITTYADGIYAYNNLTVVDGTYSITCKGSVNSSKALKTGNILSIENGDFTISSTDDAIHSDNAVFITNGDFTLSSSDDGIHADKELQIDYGTILITKSYEGLESATITINDGDITLTASDDGVNAAGSSNNYLYINGGNLVVYASGDGLDMNGSGIMTGGTALVHGPTNNSNGPLDYDGSFKVNGGLLIAAGSSGMAQAPSSSSSQNNIMVYFTSTYSANTLFHLEDSNGNEIVTFSPKHQYSSVTLSSPNILKGSSYSVYTSGSSTGLESGGLYSDGVYTPGTLFKTFSVSSTSTTVGTSSSSGPGGRSISSTEL